MKKLESPHTMYRHISPGLDAKFFERKKVEALWNKVNELIDWINAEEERRRLALNDLLEAFDPNYEEKE